MTFSRIPWTASRLPRGRWHVEFHGMHSRDGSWIDRLDPQPVADVLRLAAWKAGVLERLRRRGREVDARG